MRYRATVAGRSFDLEVDHDRLVWVDGRPLYVDMEQVGGLPVYSLGIRWQWCGDTCTLTSSPML